MARSTDFDARGSREEYCGDAGRPGCLGRSGGPRPLRNRVAAAEQQRDEYLALLQRTRADFENYQKRIQRDLAEEPVTAMRLSPETCCRSWTTCNVPWR